MFSSRKWILCVCIFRKHFFLHCFICRPSEDAGIEPLGTLLGNSIVLMPIRIQIRLSIWCRSRSASYPKFYTCWKIRKHFFYIYSQKFQPALFCVSRQRYRCHDFQYFRQYNEIFWKKCVVLKCIRIRIGGPWIRLRYRQHDAESDRIRIRIHNTDQDPCDFGIGSQSP